MYQNVHFPVAAFAEAAVKSPGLCSVKIFRIEDVLTWPAFDPLTGMLAASLVFKPGKTIYLLESIDASRIFTENQKLENAGRYFEITVNATLKGSTAAHHLTVGTLIHYQWGMLVADKNGVTRLIGNQDSGAEIISSYTSGQGTDSRKTELTFKWEHPQPAPIYTAAAFDIVIGGIIVTAGALTLLYRFQVGAAGAPMNDGDAILVNEGFKNKNLLILADGTGIPIDDFSGDIDWTGSTQRHAEHAPTSNTINFVGNVVGEEIIEIYAFTL